MERTWLYRPGPRALLLTTLRNLEPGTFSESQFLYLANDLGGCHEDEVD